MPVIAKTTVRIGGRVDMVHQGAVYDDDDPVVLAHPYLFESPDEAALMAQPKDDTRKLGERSMTSRHNQPVEQATDAPGERRSVRRGRAT